MYTCRGAMSVGSFGPELCPGGTAGSSGDHGRTQVHRPAHVSLMHDARLSPELLFVGFVATCARPVPPLFKANMGDPNQASPLERMADPIQRADQPQAQPQCITVAIITQARTHRTTNKT